MKRWIILGLLALLLSTNCNAQENILWEELGVDKLAQAGDTYGTGVVLSPDLELNEGLDDLADRTAQYLPEILRSALRGALMLLVIVLLCAMAEGVHAAGKSGNLQVSVMAGALAIAAVSANDMNSLMGLGRSTIDSMQGFGQVMLPVIAAVTAASGQAAGAAVRQIATAAFSNVLLALIDQLLVPLVYAYVAACAAYAAVGNPGLQKVAEVLKWVANKLLTILLVGFVTYLTVSGVIAGNTDAAALKVAKAAISSVVPVVGRIIADAAESVLVGAGLLRNTVGIFGMMAVLGICIVPFLQLGLHYLIYKLSAALASTMADSRLGELINGIGTAFGMILGMTGASALLLLISIVSGLAGGGV